MRLLTAAKQWDQYELSKEPVVISTNSPIRTSSKQYCKYCDWNDYLFTTEEQNDLNDGSFSKKHNSTEWHRFNVNIISKYDKLPFCFDEFMSFSLENKPKCPFNMSLVDFLVTIVKENTDLEEDRIPSSTIERSPRIEFNSKKNCSKIQIWKCIFNCQEYLNHSHTRDNSYGNSQLSSNLYNYFDKTTCPSNEYFFDFGNRFISSSWLLFLCGGGYFAAGIFCNSTEVPLVHKTFHRYTVRKGQGGSQALKDLSKRANSAGSSLRRYNEVALIKDIQDTLNEWNSLGHFGSTNIVFFNSTLTNKALLDSSCIKNVCRNSFPFSTYRATWGEIQRCYKNLTEC